MRLHSIKSADGANRRLLRVGRGEGNGRGKTCGRGHKGQRSRAGFSQRPGFESGHVPLYRRLPHRGFNNKNFTTTYEIVNLVDIADIAVEEITPEILKEKGLIRSAKSLVKVLADGELKTKVTISAHKFSKKAAEMIEAAGGEAKLIASKPESGRAPAEG